MRKFLLTVLMTCAGVACTHVQEFALKGYDNARGLVFGADPLPSTCRVGIEPGFKSEVGRRAGTFDAASIYFEPFVTRHLLWETARQKSAIAKWQEGVGRHRAGDHTGARQAYTAALAEDGKLFEALVNRSVAHAGLGEFELAHADLTEAMGLVEASDLFFRRAWINYRLGSLIEAENDIALAIERDDHLPAYHVFRAIAQFERGMAVAARRAADDALEHDPRNPFLYVLRGTICAQQEKPEVERAVEDFERAIGMGYDEAWVRIATAHLLGALGRWREARAHIEYYLAAVGDGDAEALVFYARAMHELGEYRIANDEYTKALGLRPEWAEIYVERARCRQRIDMLEEACGDFTAALEMQAEKSADTFLERSLLFRRMNRDTEAADDYRTYVKLRGAAAQSPIFREGSQ